VSKYERPGRAVAGGLSTAPVVPELRTRTGGASARKIVGHAPERSAEQFEGAVGAIVSRRHTK
jgi:hypothetical protein